MEIVRQALEHRHTVTAFVREPERLKTFRDRITIVQGDLLNAVELETAIRGQDGVLSAFGPRVPISKADSNLLRRFAVTLTGAMLHTGTRRTVVVSTAFLFKNSIVPPAYLFGRLFFSDLVADAAEMEKVFTKSGLDWTIVRPPQLTDKPRTAKYRVRENNLPPFGFTISRADVADFLIKTVANAASIGTVVGVSN
jgi:putative NADH-flavin reductase